MPGDPLAFETGEGGGGDGWQSNRGQCPARVCWTAPPSSHGASSTVFPTPPPWRTNLGSRCSVCNRADVWGNDCVLLPWQPHSGTEGNCCLNSSAPLVSRWANFDTVFYTDSQSGHSRTVSLLSTVVISVTTKLSWAVSPSPAHSITPPWRSSSPPK